MTKNERERARKHLYKQKGSQNWFLRFYLHGKQVRETTGTPDETEACRVALARLDEAGADRSGAKKFIGPEQKKITVNLLLDNLESDYRLRGIDSPQFRSHMKRIREHFGDWRAVEVTAAEVDRYIEKRLADGARPASVNRAVQVFGQSFNLAVERGLLNSAPKFRHLSEADNARQGFFAERELRAVVDNLPAYLQDFTLFGFLVGWRKGEIASLQWADVDRDCIRLRPEHSKNGEGRVIVLEGELRELIERRTAARTVKTDTSTVLSALIFHNGHGEPIVDTRKAWARACCMAGVGKMVCPTCEEAVDAKHTCAKCSKTWKYEELKYAGKIFHDLRRSSVRNMIRAGVPEKIAMTLSGHKTHSMLSRYNIINETDQREALRRTQDYLKVAAAEESKVVKMSSRVQ
jgi:integrase